MENTTQTVGKTTEICSSQSNEQQEKYGVSFTPLLRNTICSLQGHDEFSIHGVIGEITNKTKTIVCHGKRIRVTSLTVVNEEGNTTRVNFFGGKLK